MIYLKEIDGKLMTAPSVYIGEDIEIPGFNQNIELMQEKGYNPYDECDYSLYLTGAKVLKNGKLVDNESEEYKDKVAKEKEEIFSTRFIETSLGWLRDKPKGYLSIVEAMNSALNVVYIQEELPEGVITLYPKPDFMNVKDIEKYLKEHSYKNKKMTAQEFGSFYVEFMNAWNTKEHIS